MFLSQEVKSPTKRHKAEKQKSLSRLTIIPWTDNKKKEEEEEGGGRRGRENKLRNPSEVSFFDN